jgi:hypothetical protein
MRHHQDNERERLAKHCGQPVKCEQYGHMARRKARHPAGKSGLLH